MLLIVFLMQNDEVSSRAMIGNYIKLISFSPPKAMKNALSKAMLMVVGR